MKTKSIFYCLLFILACKVSHPVTVSIPAVPHTYKLSHQIEKEIAASPMSWKYQRAAWDYSYIGAYKKSLETWDKDISERDTLDEVSWEEFNANYSPTNANDYIAVPSDIQERKTSKDKITLILEKGEYTLRIQDGKRKAKSMDLIVE